MVISEWIVLLQTNPGRHSGNPTLLLRRLRKLRTGSSNEWQCWSNSESCISAIIPKRLLRSQLSCETSSQRPRVEATPGSDDAPAAAVNDDDDHVAIRMPTLQHSKLECGPILDDIFPATRR